MDSWTGEVEDSDEEVDGGFAATLQEHVDDGTVPEIPEIDLVDGIDDVDDESLLKQAYRQLTGNGHDEMENIVKNRLHDLDAAIPEPETEQGSLDETTDDPEEEDSGEEAAEPDVTRLDEEDDQSGTDEEETDESEPEPTSGPPEPTNAMTPSQVADLDRRWKILTFGPPKLFKTHFGFTMPEPIAFLDLEGKADDVASKFEDKEMRVWQPKRMEAEPDTKFRRAKKALDEALEWLEWHHEHNDEVGTVVVDSISLLWEWAQIHHKIENYPMKDEDDIELSSNFKSSAESDWAVIKEYHNAEFRERITDSPFHFYWTAMERVDFEETLNEDDNNRIMESTGEPKNDYKADTIIHARSHPEHEKAGDLVGSNFTDNRFVGLPRPTFPKLRDAIEQIEEAEASDQDISRAELAEEIGVEAVIRYNPQRYDG